MNLLSLPEKFWHCAVTLCKGESGECAVVNDLEKDKLLREIVEPWHAHRAFKVGWFVVTSREMVAQIKITHTEQPVSFYHDQHYESTRQSGIVDTVTNTGYIPIETGEDFTGPLLFEDVVREQEIMRLSGQIKIEVDELHRKLEKDFGL